MRWHPLSSHTVGSSEATSSESVAILFLDCVFLGYHHTRNILSHTVPTVSENLCTSFRFSIVLPSWKQGYKRQKAHPSLPPKPPPSRSLFTTLKPPGSIEPSSALLASKILVSAVNMGNRNSRLEKALTISPEDCRFFGFQNVCMGV